MTKARLSLMGRCSIYTVKPDITKETVLTLFFVISREYISNYGNIHCYMKTNNSSLFNIYKFKFIKRDKLLYNMICECYVISNSIFDPKTHRLLISGYSL